MENGMKKVLIITYYWPPTGGSGVQRWVKFSRYLPQFGWQPIIYTPENPEMTSVDESLAKEVPEGTPVIRRHITEFYDLYRKFFGGKGKAGQEVNPINSQKKTFKQKLALFLRGNLFIPDPRITWVRPSVKFLKKYLKEHPVDAIVSTGPPHSMHLIAKKLAKATGLPWVADFRDPWTRMFYYKHLELCALADRKQHRLERQVLDNASVVVVVSPLVQDDFRQMTDTPVELITNGFDEEDFTGTTERDGFFNVTHTGLFASDGNPEVLWKVLAEKCRQDGKFKSLLRIRLAGKTDAEIIASIRAAGLEDNLVDLGYQEHKAAIREQKSASLLILPLRKEPEYKATLPGKLFEYIATLNPILGIGQTDGAMAQIVNQTKTGVVFDWEDEDSIASFVNLCWREFSAADSAHPAKPSDRPMLADTANVEAIRQYSRKETARHMAALLDSLVK